MDSPLWGLLAPFVYVVVRDTRSLVRGTRETLVAAGSGVVSLIAYGYVTYAMPFWAMGVVSALRETSVAFAALIVRLFLHERLSAYWMAACIIVAVGVILIA